MIKSVYRAKAPLRLGLAGGGTDVSPYCDQYGGAVLNITINRYALATIIIHGGDYVKFMSHDLDEDDVCSLSCDLPISEGLVLHRALYNKVMQDHNDGQPIGLTVVTSVECPRGAGLGASSALVVAMLEAYKAALSLPLGEYDVAHYAFEVERHYAGMSGGGQDQYAATFGGINFMEFASRNQVIVNPLNLKQSTINELESSIITYFTGVSRDSSKVIKNQVKAVNKQGKSLDAMHQLKRDALEMKAALLRGEVHEVGEILNRSWEAKKASSSAVSNAHIDEIYDAVMKAGASAAKISGAGGGGFMMVYVDPVHREDVVKVLKKFDGQLSSCSFSSLGATSWKVKYENYFEDV